MTRFDEWLRELKRATHERLRLSHIKLFEYQLNLVSEIKVIEERKWKFVVVGQKERFAIAMDGTIYGFKNADVNKKEHYGNVDTFEEFDWSTYYPVRKSLYDWKQNSTDGNSIDSMAKGIKNRGGSNTKRVGRIDRMLRELDTCLGTTGISETGKLRTASEKGDRKSIGDKGKT